MFKAKPDGQNGRLGQVSDLLPTLLPDLVSDGKLPGLNILPHEPYLTTGSADHTLIKIGGNPARHYR